MSRASPCLGRFWERVATMGQSRCSEGMITIPTSYIEVGMVMMLQKGVTCLRREGAPLHLENLRKTPS
jgi:hypothetical protein